MNVRQPGLHATVEGGGEGDGNRINPKDPRDLKCPTGDVLIFRKG